MTPSKQAFLCVALCVLPAGCANIPKAQSPLEVHRSFAASFEKVWNGSMGAVEALNGTVLARDESGGLIGCKIPYGDKGTDEYLNISIVRPGPNGLMCRVHVVPYAFSVSKAVTQIPSPEGPKVILIAEFDDIHFRKNHLSDVSNAFLESLDERVGQGKP